MHPAAVLLAAMLASSPLHAASESVIYAFKGGADGQAPLGGVVKVGAALYGTTDQTVFKLTSPGIDRVLAEFTAFGSGGESNAALLNVGGTLYGTAVTGGANDCGGAGCGAVFKLGQGGTPILVYAFKGGSDGAYPSGGLTDIGGTLYGTTLFGGGGGCGDARGCGTVFKLTADGTETVLYAFSGGYDGATGAIYPGAAMIAVGDTLYGTTEAGGVNGGGTVFSITPSGTMKVLYSFKGGEDGSDVNGGLVELGGALYGTTAFGGIADAGTVFKITTSGAETVLYPFKGCADGSQPVGSLLKVDGMLYGTTTGGGTGGDGTLFQITPAGAETVLHSFRGGADGASPNGGLIRGTRSFYGTTYAGGLGTCTGGCGTVFRVTPKD
jgi:uncharacterized repeat protein (TIGR03803 family)